MGSPCNAFGNDPEPGTNQGVACSDVTGQMWANVNSYGSDKSNGDAFQAHAGCSSAVDGCSSSTNTDYTANGYFYTVSVKAAMPSLTIQLFDPVWVNTGLTCDASTTGSGGVTTNFGGGNGATPPPLSTTALNDVVTDEATRYKPGSAEPYCTGDAAFSGTAGPAMKTQFTVRDPGTATPWDPTSFPIHAGCQSTYPGYTGQLFNVLDQYTSGTTLRTTYNQDSSGATTAPTIVDGFRRWTTLCTIANPPIGDYLVQVKTTGLGVDTANGSNHFAIRAYGANLGENNSISIAGREKMGMFSNKPGATNEFHLARVPTGAAGQMLRLSLFDVGDSTQTGTIYIQYPPGAVGGPFTGCQGSGPASGPLTNCSFQAIYSGGVSDHQGKWQVVSVPIPANYSCDDDDPRACWVRLKYDYGAGSAPHDVTSWAASIDGDPVRLVE
jgi:hypothetical protein